MELLIDIMIDAAHGVLYTLLGAIEILIPAITLTMYIIEKGGGYGILIVLLLTILSFNAETITSIMKHQWNARGYFFSRMLNQRSQQTVD